MPELKRLVIFSILMENGRGILNKSPTYVHEKWHSAMNVLYPEKLLDANNVLKYLEYLKQWVEPIATPVSTGALREESD